MRSLSMALLFTASAALAADAVPYHVIKSGSTELHAIETQLSVTDSHEHGTTKVTVEQVPAGTACGLFTRTNANGTVETFCCGTTATYSFCEKY